MKRLFILGLVFSIISLLSFSINSAFAGDNTVKEAIAKYKNKNYLGCISDLRIETTKDAENTIAWYYLANSYMNIGMKKEAHEAFDKVVKLNTVPKLTSYSIQAKICMENEKKCNYQNFSNEQIAQLKENPSKFLESYFANLNDNKDKVNVEIEKLINGEYNSKIHPEASRIIMQERTKIEQSKINNRA